MQDQKFPNCFSKNPFKICDFDSLKKKIGAEFLKYKDEHNLLFVCSCFYFCNFKIFFYFPITNQFSASLFFFVFNQNSPKMPQRFNLFYVVIAEILENKKQRKPRTQTLDIARSKKTLKTLELFVMMKIKKI